MNKETIIIIRIMKNRKVKSIKNSNFLTKSILILIITTSMGFYTLFFLNPNNIFFVLLFLLTLFVFIKHFLSLLIFLIIEWRNKKIWYIKDDFYATLLLNTTFIALFVDLLLVLLYLKIANLVTVLILVAILLISFLKSR